MEVVHAVRQVVTRTDGKTTLADSAVVRRVGAERRGRSRIVAALADGNELALAAALADVKAVGGPAVIAIILRLCSPLHLLHLLLLLFLRLLGLSVGNAAALLAAAALAARTDVSTSATAVDGSQVNDATTIVVGRQVQGRLSGASTGVGGSAVGNSDGDSNDDVVVAVFAVLDAGGKPPGGRGGAQDRRGHCAGSTRGRMCCCNGALFLGSAVVHGCRHDLVVEAGGDSARVTTSHAPRLAARAQRPPCTFT